MPVGLPRRRQLGGVWSRTTPRVERGPGSCASPSRRFDGSIGVPPTAFYPPSSEPSMTNPPRPDAHGHAAASTVRTSCRSSVWDEAGPGYGGERISCRGVLRVGLPRVASAGTSAGQCTPLFGMFLRRPCTGDRSAWFSSRLDARLSGDRLRVPWGAEASPVRTGCHADLPAPVPAVSRRPLRAGCNFAGWSCSRMSRAVGSGVWSRTTLPGHHGAWSGTTPGRRPAGA